MQEAMDRVSQACDKYDIKIQPAHGSQQTITVNGQRLQAVDKFTYPGSILSRAVHIDNEVTARIAKASVTFGRLRGNV